MGLDFWRCLAAHRAQLQRLKDVELRAWSAFIGQVLHHLGAKRKDQSEAAAQHVQEVCGSGICQHGRQRSTCKKCAAVESVSMGGSAVRARSVEAVASVSMGGAGNMRFCTTGQQASSWGVEHAAANWSIHTLANMSLRKPHSSALSVCGGVWWAEARHEQH